ncbi:hypothetical protein B9Z19DRAFT_1126363 [Tuber borchii]|uniref:UBA domain-containing protein n=1 Tax=Tuber borchii TaxID=42251 RepID=A0A2T6ZT64_TUBBO|nr:hypothetical protein B9Z19DRAFT_1126363 [Tuber borchii]
MELDAEEIRQLVEKGFTQQNTMTGLLLGKEVRTPQRSSQISTSSSGHSTGEEGTDVDVAWKESIIPAYSEGAVERGSAATEPIMPPPQFLCPLSIRGDPPADDSVVTMNIGESTIKPPTPSNVLHVHSTIPFELSSLLTTVFGKTPDLSDVRKEVASTIFQLLISLQADDLFVARVWSDSAQLKRVTFMSPPSDQGLENITELNSYKIFDADQAALFEPVIHVFLKGELATRMAKEDNLRCLFHILHYPGGLKTECIQVSIMVVLRQIIVDKEAHLSSKQSTIEKTEPPKPETESKPEARSDPTKETEEPAKVTGDKEMVYKPKPVAKVKPLELENPEGVTHFLRSELLAIDAIDNHLPPHAPKEDIASVPMDVQMQQGESRGKSVEVPREKWFSKLENPEFKAEQHPNSFTKVSACKL